MDTTLNRGIQRERSIDLTKWQLVVGTTNEYERIPDWRSTKEYEDELKENRKRLTEDQARSLLEGVINTQKLLTNMWEKDRVKLADAEKKIKELEANLGGQRVAQVMAIEQVHAAWAKDTAKLKAKLEEAKQFEAGMKGIADIQSSIIEEQRLEIEKLERKIERNPW